MEKKEKVVRLFIDAYNRQDIAACAKYLDENVKLISTYALLLFPESGGTISGKKLTLDYLEWLFHQIDGLEAHEYELDFNGEYFVVRGDSDSQELNYYMHYYLNEDNLLYLIKSNLTRPIE